MGVALFFSAHTWHRTDGRARAVLQAMAKCSKRNVDYMKAMSLPRCAKLPHLANIKCAERILEEKKKNARSH
jgi:hypothetical protein